MPVNVTISTDQVPASYCVTDIATDWPFLVQLLSGQIAGTANLYNFGSSTPVAADEDKPWILLHLLAYLAPKLLALSYKFNR